MKTIDYISLIHKKLTNQMDKQSSDLYAKEEGSADFLKNSRDLEKIWEVSKTYSPNVKFDADKAYKRFTSQLNNQKTPERIVATKSARIFVMNRTKWMAGIAAAFVIGFSLFLFNGGNNSNYIDFKAVDGNLSVDLADGSQVILKEGSKLRVSDDFNVEDRSLILEGFAFFDVAKNKELPFIVESASKEDDFIQVIGTQFNLAFSKEEMRLEVKEGVVKYANGEKNEIAKKSQAMTFVYAEATIDKNRLANNKSFDWISSERLSFENTPLSEVITQIESYFNVEFKSDIGTINADCPFTAPNLKNPKIIQVLELLKASFEMRYQMDKSERIITLLDINATCIDKE